MNRRLLLRSTAAAAAVLAAPRLAGAQDRRVLRFVPYVDLAILDPQINTASQTRNYAYMVFDTLYAQDDGFNPRPEMVEGHQVDADFRLWTLTLRDGLRWHDGTPVLARDCVASIRRWGAADPAGRALMSYLAEMTAPSDKVMVLRMREPYRQLPDVLGKIASSMPAMLPERLANTPTNRPITEIIGSGPFRFVPGERVPGSRNVFERFDAYVPRPGGTPGLTAGPKLVKLDRVEWLTMPEAGTAAAALRSGEVDWWEAPPPDLVPTMRNDRRLVTRVIDKTGVVPVLRFNSLQPPFDNPAVRRAVLHAARQDEFMEAFSSDRSQWRDGVGLFTPGTPMASDAGMDRISGPVDLAAARRAITAAGYRNERVVVMQPTDHPVNNAMAAMGADLFGRLGLNVDIQAMDAGTMFQRRANREGVDKGGWSAFPSMVGGTDSLNPAVSFLARGNGADAWYGWPTIPGLEAARAAWFQAPDLATQQRCCADMQLALLDNAPHLQLGQILQPTSYRTNLAGVLDGIPKFWNVSKE